MNRKNAWMARLFIVSLVIFPLPPPIRSSEDTSTPSRDDLGDQEVTPVDNGDGTESSEAEAEPPALDTSRFLLGDWWGSRTKLDRYGINFDLQWTQSVQGVVSGGRDSKWKYGGSVDFLTSLDLGKMGAIPGGFVRALVQGRYGESVIGEAGTILPVNTDLYFPLTDELDDDIVALTELSYTQFFAKQFGVVVGKLQTLDGDPNEFASGRGRSQFMNFNFVAPNLVGLAIPYSTLGAGALILPTDQITIVSLILNTTDASTSTGFDDIGDGSTWLTEGQFQYRLSHLPGGQNIGFAYAFDNDFLLFNRPGLPGGGIIQTSNNTWTFYWSTWQYLLTLDDAPRVIRAGDGRPDVRGLGLFARTSVVDPDTNIVRWGISAGLGGRGLIPTRDEDTFGLGFAYTEFSQDGLLASLLIDDNAYGGELFYNASLVPGVSLTGDLQVFDPASRRVDTTVVLGARLNIQF